MEDQIKEAIKDVIAGKYSRQDALLLRLSLYDDVMSSTEYLVTVTGNVMQRRIYLEMIDELDHYVRQLK